MVEPVDMQDVSLNQMGSMSRIPTLKIRHLDLLLNSTHVRLKQMHGANFLSISSNPVFLAQLHPQQWCKNPPKDPSHSVPHVLVQELSIK